MTSLLAVLGLGGPAALIITLLVVALLSQRLGAVTKRRSAYRWFFAAIALISFSMLIRLLTINTPPELLDPNTELLYNLPLVVALTLSVLVAWQYWGWLLSENPNSRDRQKGDRA